MASYKLPKHVYALRHDTGYAGFITSKHAGQPKSHILTFTQKRDALNTRSYFCYPHEITKRKDGTIFLEKQGRQLTRSIKELEVEQLETMDAIAQLFVNNTRMVLIDNTYITPNNIKFRSRIDLEKAIEIDSVIIAQNLSLLIESHDDDEQGYEIFIETDADNADDTNEDDDNEDGGGNIFRRIHV